MWPGAETRPGLVTGRGSAAALHGVEVGEDRVELGLILREVHDALEERRGQRGRHQVRCIEHEGLGSVEGLGRPLGEVVRVGGERNALAARNCTTALDPDLLGCGRDEVLDQRLGLRRVIEHAEQVAAALDGAGVLGVDVREGEEVVVAGLGMALLDEEVGDEARLVVEQASRRCREELVASVTEVGRENRLRAAVDVVR